MKNTIHFKTVLLATFLGTVVATMSAFADDKPPAETELQGPRGMTISVKMIGPYNQPTDLQIIGVFKHKATGDTYLGAMKELDAQLGGLLSSLRNRGEFAGDLGETLVLIPPPNSITPRRLLLIGLGDESNLSLDTFRYVGRIALREAIAAKASNVSFAPVVRDQGNNTIDVGEGDRAVVENIILSYDTERRLQAQELAAPAEITKWTIEAGPTFFDGAVSNIQKGIESAGAEAAKRENAPFVSNQKTGK